MKIIKVYLNCLPLYNSLFHSLACSYTGYTTAIQISTLEITDENSPDLKFLELKAKEIVLDIKKKFNNTTSAEEISRMSSCFYGRSIDVVLKKEFRFLRGEIVLIKNILDFVKRNVKKQVQQTEICDYSFFKTTGKHTKKIKYDGIAALPFGNAFVDNYDYKLAYKSKQLNKLLSAENSGEHQNSVEKVDTEVISVLVDVFQALIFNHLTVCVKKYHEKIEDVILKLSDVKAVLDTILKKPKESDIKLAFNILCYCNENFQDFINRKKVVISYDSTCYFRFNQTLNNELSKVFTPEKQSPDAVCKKFNEILCSHSSIKSCWMINYIRHVAKHENKACFKNTKGIFNFFYLFTQY